SENLTPLDKAKRIDTLRDYREKVIKYAYKDNNLDEQEAKFLDLIDTVLKKLGTVSQPTAQNQANVDGKITFDLVTRHNVKFEGKEEGVSAEDKRIILARLDSIDKIIADKLSYVPPPRQQPAQVAVA
ncbi:MAG: hypothetical protein AABY22_08355, partial [Nanoarchaeota archaeon]